MVVMAAPNIAEIFRTGYFAIIDGPFPVPDAIRQRTISRAIGLLFHSEAPAKTMQFWPGVGEWQMLSGRAADVWIGKNDDYVRVPISRPEAVLILRRLRPDATLPD
jgi:hypothetical protein